VDPAPQQERRLLPRGEHLLTLDHEGDENQALFFKATCQSSFSLSVNWPIHEFIGMSV
jgi:hypothetical protein